MLIYILLQRLTDLCGRSTNTLQYKLTKMYFLYNFHDFVFVFSCLFFVTILVYFYNFYFTYSVQPDAIYPQ